MRFSRQLPLPFNAPATLPASRPVPAAHRAGSVAAPRAAAVLPAVAPRGLRGLAVSPPAAPDPAARLARAALSLEIPA